MIESSGTVYLHVTHRETEVEKDKRLELGMNLLRPWPRPFLPLASLQWSSEHSN